MDAKTMIPFSPDFESKGYKLIYRNGERPEDYKIWPDGRITTFNNGHKYAHESDGRHGASDSDFDLFLTPPEMYVGVWEDMNTTMATYSTKDLDAYAPGYKLYRLVPVE